MKYAVAVKGIIKKEDKILIIKRSGHEDHRPGVWETVGGRMDQELSPEEELKREVMEETGLTIDICGPFNTFSFVRDTGEFVVGISYICNHVSGDVVLSDEHADHKWILPEEFSAFITDDSLYRELKRYVNLCNS